MRGTYIHEGKEIIFHSERFCIQEQIPLDEIAVSAV
jgi:hypothetical protein